MHIRFIRTLLFAITMLSISAASFAQIGISISFGPPELPVYEQPLCPGEGYLWTPGYWAYANDFDDYYWVPGTWVMAPEVGFLWTPGYWGWGGNGYVFYDGYWGQQVGFYGGISYGYGYFGDGYQGGRWDNGHFFYNRSVNNVNVTIIHNVYNTTVINNTVNRVSFNGGNGGVNRRPTPQEEAVVHEKHIPPVAAQVQHMQAARATPDLRASVNHGAPPVAATPRPGALTDRAVVPAKQAGAPYNRPVNRAGVQPVVETPAAHPDNKTARPEQPVTNQPEANRAERNRQPAIQPNNRPDPPDRNSQPVAQRNNQPEPAQRAQTPPPSERSQAQRTPPPVETRRPVQEQVQPAAQKQVEKKQEEKKQKDEQPKRDEKPPQQ